MTLRRRSELKPSSGTQWPTKVRAEINARDGGTCVAARALFPPAVLSACVKRPVELDHVRNGGTGIKSRSTADNGVSLCAWCHKWKTDHGKEARPLLTDYLAQFYGGSCAHVDPVFGCDSCAKRKAVPA